MRPAVSNLFHAHPPGATNEQFFALAEAADFKLEHIVSNGQATAPGFWYDQPRPEWVLLMRGQATLSFGHDGEINLKAGDYLLIPAHAKHRVEFCSGDAHWLALHFREEIPRV